jgi:hypothetical protein
MVRVANVILHKRGGDRATAKDNDSAPGKGVDVSVTNTPVPTTGEPETMHEATAEADPEVPTTEQAAQETTEEPATATRRSSADKTSKKEARRAERVEKKESRHERRDTKKVAKKEARKEANDAKKEARATAAAEKKEKAAAKAAAIAENPESAGYFARLLSWGRGGSSSPKSEGELKAGSDAESSDDSDVDVDDEETQVGEAAGEQNHPEPSAEPSDELYVVNDIPIRMTVAQPQPIAAC